MKVYTMSDKIDTVLQDKIREMYCNNKYSMTFIAKELNIEKKFVKRELIKLNIIERGNKLTLDEFIRRAKEVHGDRYDYSKVVYPKDNHKKVEIICKSCGKEFLQSIIMHLQGYGCECQRTCFSKGELAVREWLKKHSIRYEVQKRFEGCKDKHCLPFDFYLPDYKVAIEYQGEQHYNLNSLLIKKYSEREAVKQLEKQRLHDKIKKKYCKENDIYFIEIIYDEDIDKAMSFEYALFKDRYLRIDGDFPEPKIDALSKNFQRLSVETTYSRCCEICSNEFIPPVLRNGHLSNVTVCCKECARKLRKKKSLEKYGYESPNQSPEIKAKTRRTNIEKYGVENYSQTKEFREKARQTNLERYGVENGSQSEEARRKISEALTKNIWTIEMDEKLKHLYIDENMPVEDIVIQFNMSYASVIRELRKLDLHRSGSKLIAKIKVKYHITKDELKDLYVKQKLNYKQICEKTGMSEGTLSRRLKEFGLVNPEKSMNTNNIKYTTETWIERAKAIHGDKYDYSLVEYKDSKTKVKIICKSCGRTFEQNPNHHLRGCGCKYCRHKNS